jgi:Outer membrane protein beta-barrel domain
VTMRTPGLALVFTLVCAAPAMGQITYGARAGVNFANVSFDGQGDVPTSGRVGLLAGGFATIPLRGWLAAQPELIYTVKGARLDIADIDTDFIVDYVEVPLLARIPIRRKLYVAVGPSMAFRVRARSRTSFGGSTEEFDLKDDVETFDLGIVGAAGIEFGRWVVDGRYTHGLSDFDADTSDDVKIRNRVFSLSAGIRF